MEIKIEKGIQMPSQKKKYPFSEMKVGDSFFVEEKDKFSARSHASVYGEENEKKFITRSVEGGIRIWRIE